MMSCTSFTKFHSMSDDEQEVPSILCTCLLDSTHQEWSDPSYL